VNYNLKFIEGFATSFRKWNILTSVQAPAAVGDQTTPGASNTNTESGFNIGSLPRATVSM
jgi:hypothetical protein